MGIKFSEAEGRNIQLLLLRSWILTHQHFLFRVWGCKNLYLLCLCSASRDAGLQRRTNKGSSRGILLPTLFTKLVFSFSNVTEEHSLTGSTRRFYITEDVCTQEAKLKNSKANTGLKSKWGMEKQEGGGGPDSFCPSAFSQGFLKEFSAMFLSSIDVMIMRLCGS